MPMGTERRMGRRCVVALVVMFFGAAWLGSPASIAQGAIRAQAANPMPVRTLSPPGGGVVAASATDGTGGAVVAVWAQRRRERWSLRFSERGADGQWSAAQALVGSRHAVGVDSMDVDAGRDGTVTVVWSRRRRGAPGLVEAVTRAPGGRFGGPVALGRGPALEPVGVRVAADDVGGAIVIWPRRRGDSAGEVVVRVRRGPSWRPARVVGSSDGRIGETGAAGAGHGVLAAAWIGNDLSSGQRVRLVRVTPRGALARIPLRTASDHRLAGEFPALAARPDGTLLLGVRPGGVRVVEVSPSNGVSELLTADDAGTWPPAVATSPAGDRVAVWGRIDEPQDFLVAMWAPGQPLASPATLFRQDDLIDVIDPAVAVSDDGTVALAIAGTRYQDDTESVELGLQPRGGPWSTVDPLPQLKLSTAEIAGVAVVSGHPVALIRGGVRAQRLLAVG